ncbi:MAG: hypothetical protein NT066_02140 [Candidatus Omnitrophica bacterium]|nr:hypothetical protein [Candidatus Omnitrophota bacterium]
MGKIKKIIKLWRKGFSLVEMMFGVFILLAVIIPALFSFINCMLLNRASRNLTTAANDAQYVLEQIKAWDYDTRIATNFPSGYTLSTPTLNNEAVAFDPAPTIGSSISKITVKVSWTERQKSRSFSLATYFAR